MPLEDRTTFQPLVLMEHNDTPGSYSLLLTDDHMVKGNHIVFQENGREACGYGWADVALCTIRRNAPELEERLGMDPEAGMFCAYGTDLSALKELAALLHAAFHNKILLAELVKEAPWEYD